MKMSKHRRQLDARSRLEEAIQEMYTRTHKTEQCNDSLFQSLKHTPAPQPGSRQNIALHLSLERSDTPRLSVLVRGTTLTAAGEDKACWHFEHGPLSLEGNDSVQVLQLPRITAAFETPVEMTFTGSGAHTVTLNRVDAELAPFECTAIQGGLHSLADDYGVMINMDEFTFLFPVATVSQDAAVSKVFSVTHDAEIGHEQCLRDQQLDGLVLHAQQLLRLNYAGALKNAPRAAPGDPPTCKALDAKLRRFKKLFAGLEASQAALLPSARMLDVLALFQVSGAVLRPRLCSCSSGHSASIDGAQETARKVVQLCDTARKLGSVWQELTSTTLPACSDGVQHLIEQNNLDSHHDFDAQLQRLHELRQAQCKLIDSTRDPKRVTAAPTPGLLGLAWTGGGYPAMVDVRAHYIGLGAIDAACLRLSCVMTKTPCSAAVLPPSVHVWQVQQLWANNEYNNIALSESAYQHNIALAQDMAATAPLPHASDLASGAPATLAAVAMMGIEPDCQLASSVCASPVHSNDLAGSVPAAPALESVNPGAGRQHLALCQLHALVNSDLLNRLITPPLHRHIVSAMQAAAASLRSEPALDPATLAHARKMRECAALEVVHLFGAEVQPLARQALLGRPPPAGVNLLAFLESDTAAAYDRNKCLHRVAGFLFDAEESKRMPSAQQWQRVVGKTRQTSRRAVHWRKPLQGEGPCV